MIGESQCKKSADSSTGSSHKGDLSGNILRPEFDGNPTNNQWLDYVIEEHKQVENGLYDDPHCDGDLTDVHSMAIVRKMYHSATRWEAELRILNP